MTTPRIGTFEWDRALTFLHQSRAPFAEDIEPAMRWRLLPPLVAHAVGLRGFGALIIPYLGLLAWFALWCHASALFLSDRFSAVVSTILLGTTAAALSVTTMYGVNDAWFILALLVVTIGKRARSLVLPIVLGPWVDERFLFALGGALFCRWWLQDRPKDFVKQVAWAVASLVPYVLLRGGYTLMAHDRGAGNFVRDALHGLPVYLPYGRLGWWMGFRVAWPFLFLAIYVWYREAGRVAALVGALAFAAGLAAVTALAADLSRSTNLLIPLLFCGIIALRQCATLTATRAWLTGVAVLNVLAPFATITYTKIVPYWSLPMELIRLWRSQP